MLQTVNDFLEENLVRYTTDGTPVMLGSRSGFQAFVKLRALLTGVHRFIHWEVLPKTLTAYLNKILKGLVKIANHLKWSAVKFQKLCQDLGSDFNIFTTVRWLSVANVQNRILHWKRN